MAKRNCSKSLVSGKVCHKILLLDAYCHHGWYKASPHNSQGLGKHEENKYSGELKQGRKKFERIKENR